ncbi:hypothetical protein HBI56_222170 [Parastagonospora nodorum]|uniref:Uncharacterized protein n=1 Tax=Phaeosphaeria nodorum (strain SN15 / ATCC MYA-4574 / FGSC 10173) TaxID=321614 RepID=A0A7U2NRI9_PHANO|nr:hypothetical protein HBH56_231880 [Parastagonospora nodorum]QRD07769.1 hypothetical protein JI435_161810 [Parastagonospora nodorum SN15]KAH3921377.1 hypothetical protein HBH54_241200 [Parastagonospora nodorum]KAH3939920.1 hypothetical protein HBH53_224970 [Parastagonospora nodorum]KAH3967282.1 hypothetical protein HBH52_189890 [Parastagonospora nodorum]
MSPAKFLPEDYAFFILSQRIHEYHGLARSLARVICNGKRSTWTTDAPDGTDPEDFARAIATLIATRLSELHVPVHRIFEEGDDILGEEFREELGTHVGCVIVVSLNMRDLAIKRQLGRRVDAQRQDALADLVQARDHTVFLMLCERELHIEVCGESNGRDIITQMLVQKEW